MNKCLLCGQNYVPHYYFLELISLKPLSKRPLCQQCLKKFKKLGPQRCKFCDKELASASLCQDCQNWQKIYGNNLLKNYALYHYNDSFHDLMVNYKRYGDYELRLVLQELIREQLPELNYDYYVPIPTSPEHRIKREFDTITGIFADLLPLTEILRKRAGTGAQGEKNRRKRLQTQQGFFIAEEKIFKDNTNYGRFLLLDDIYTTGRTLYHARDMLLTAFPNAKIESFSICR